jgi:hypothetical protein
MNFTIINSATTDENPHTIMSMILTDDVGKTLEMPMKYDNEGMVDTSFTRKHMLSLYEQLLAEDTINRADKTSKVIDDVYLAGSVRRKDYSINTDEGIEIVERLEAGWPDFIPSYRDNNDNLVSDFSPIRLPYSNQSISYYDMAVPSAELIATYSLPYQDYRGHYGLKFDTVTNEVLIKVGISHIEMLRVHPEICKEIEDSIPVHGGHFFALIYNSDGELDSNIDVYFNTDYTTTKGWVDSMGLEMPYSDASLHGKRILWGGIYNTTNKKITHIKAYIRNYIED